MSRIEETFSRLGRTGQGALIAYVTAGDPNPGLTSLIVDALLKGGADMIELGVPFSDPIADGPTIQAASMRALKAGMTCMGVLRLAEEIRSRHDVPIILLSYFNPIFKLGLGRFFEEAHKSGVDGVIVPDLPIEEAGQYKRLAMKRGIDTIFLAAPSTPPRRLRRIFGYTSGFLYLVSTFGVTGRRGKVRTSTLRLIKTVVRLRPDGIPVAVGFGISRPEHVRAVIGSGADGAIVGSALVRIVERNREDEQRMLDVLGSYVKRLKDASLSGQQEGEAGLC